MLSFNMADRFCACWEEGNEWGKIPQAKQGPIMQRSDCLLKREQLFTDLPCLTKNIHSKHKQTGLGKQTNKQKKQLHPFKYLPFIPP